jgi:hypothetical protein
VVGYGEESKSDGKSDLKDESDSKGRGLILKEKR